MVAGIHNKFTKIVELTHVNRHPKCSKMVPHKSLIYNETSHSKNYDKLKIKRGENAKTNQELHP